MRAETSAHPTKLRPATCVVDQLSALGHRRRQSDANRLSVRVPSARHRFRGRTPDRANRHKSTCRRTAIAFRPTRWKLSCTRRTLTSVKSSSFERRRFSAGRLSRRRTWGSVVCIGHSWGGLRRGCRELPL